MMSHDSGSGEMNDVRILVQRIVENTKVGSTAWEWAMQLAGVLHRTDPCERCDGRGSHHKHRNCHHSTEESWIRGCCDRIECKKCCGTGRVMKTEPISGVQEND